MLRNTVIENTYLNFDPFALCSSEDADTAAEADGPGRQGEHCLTLRGCFQEHVGQQRECSQVGKVSFTVSY